MRVQIVFPAKSPVGSAASRQGALVKPKKLGPQHHFPRSFAAASLGVHAPIRILSRVPVFEGFYTGGNYKGSIQVTIRFYKVPAPRKYILRPYRGSFIVVSGERNLCHTGTWGVVQRKTKPYKIPIQHL